MGDFWQKLPNWLTYFRLILVPVFVVLMINPTPLMLNFAVAVFVIAAITDYLDGLLARRYEVVSDTGRLLDPLADKILVMAALVMLVGLHEDGASWIPAWLVVLLLGRELWVTGLRGVAAKRGVVIAANQTGKLKSAFQMTGIVFLIVHYPFELFGVLVNPYLLGLGLISVSLILSLWSAASYTSAVMGTPSSRP